MRPAAQLQATIELLDLMVETKYPVDRIMAKYFREHRYIGSKDKAAISEQLYSIVRNRLSYSYLIELTDEPADSRALAAVWAREQGIELNSYFTGEKFYPPAFSPQRLDNLTNVKFPALDDAPSHVRLNVPEWLAVKLQDSLGERYEEEMIASNLRATTDIRVNTLKSNIANVTDALNAVGYEPTQAELSPWCLRFDTRVSLFGLPAFKQGWFDMQDQGSQLLALLTGVKAGDKVVDFCAGAGGKTLAMAAMMNNKGIIDACDVHTKRLEELGKRTKRAGAHNVRIHVLSSEHDKWVKKHKGKADVVLIDAPCSGTGTWRRSPDSRWNLKPKNLDNLVKLQQSIIQSSSRLVRQGGTLFYATCSLLVEENEAQVEQFLLANPHFKKTELANLEQLNDQQHLFQTDGTSLRTYPAMSSSDGFFVCALQHTVSA